MSQWQISPVDRTGMAERVADMLRRQILDGDFPPGSELPSMAELAESLDTSRPVVREAFRILSTQGLIETAHGKLARVKGPDPAASIETLIAMMRRTEGSVRQLMDARRVLESEMAGLAARNMTPEILRQLEDSITELVHASTDEAVIEADLRFHEIIWEAADNIVIQFLLAALRGVLTRMFGSFPGHPVAIAERTAGEHRLILNALRTGDPETARATMDEALRTAEDRMETEMPQVADGVW